MTSNPAVAGQLYLEVDHRGFMIFTQSASGIIRNDRFYPWNDFESIKVLYKFVYNLHHPLDFACLSDLFFYRVPNESIWEVEYQPGKVSKFQLVSSCPGPGRQTTVIREDPETGGTVVLKRTWRRLDHLATEEAVYALFQGTGGFIPSLPHFIGPVPASTLEVGRLPEGCPLPTFSWRASKIRRRERIIQMFDSVGEPLAECQTVLQLLKAVFDAVQGSLPSLMFVKEPANLICSVF